MVDARTSNDNVHRQVEVRKRHHDRPVLTRDVVGEGHFQHRRDVVEDVARPKGRCRLGKAAEHVDVLDSADRHVPLVRADQDRIDTEIIQPLVGSKRVRNRLVCLLGVLGILIGCDQA